MRKIDYQSDWEEFAQLNPMWAILTTNNKWDKREFFETGEEEIKSVMNYLLKNKVKLNKDNALDFGCGIGRLTQALAPHFKRVMESISPHQ